MKVVFVLPVAGGGGGAHSVAQEVNELRKMGVDASIAVNANNYNSFITNYADMPAVVSSLKKFSDINSLSVELNGTDIAVATIFTSVKLIKDARELLKNKFKVAYYIQDYEPLFCTPESEQWHEARDSYTLISDAVLFTKTNWQKEIVEKNHNVKVSLVSPSIDHEVYYPSLNRDDSVTRIAAMVRPKSPRRAPRRTMRILRNLHQQYGDRVNVNIFGCEDKEIFENQLPNDFNYFNHGVLSRRQVATLLRTCHLFLDLSDYQAFGRTGLEAMATGCVSVLPVLGGAVDYSNNGIDSYLIDPRSDEDIHISINGYINLNVQARQKMSLSAILKAKEYSVSKAAISEYSMFLDIV